jgi:RimJ/RimL family protein N-acetyltransferase
MKAEAPTLTDRVVKLEPATFENVDLLVAWTLDAIAQGPHKRVPELTANQLKELFLFSSERQYFLIRRAADASPLGRFYWRAWRFGRLVGGIDWELNIFLADPQNRGKGYGTAVQRLASEYLAQQPETRTIFAFTLDKNLPERRALVKAGFHEVGPMPNQRYPAVLPEDPCTLYVWGHDSA